METDLSGPALDSKLAGLIEAAYDQSRRQRRPILVSLTQRVQSIEPIDVFGAAAGTDRMLWSQPDAGFSLTGIGAARVIETAGEHRFSATAEIWNELCSGALIEQGDAPCGPTLLGGFAFDIVGPQWSGYPEGRMVLPRLCLIGDRGRCWLTVNAVICPDTPPPLAELCGLRGIAAAHHPSNGHASPAKPRLSELRPSTQWRSEVAAAAQAVRRGDLGKVVLARAVRLQSRHNFDPTLALRRLSAGYPTCDVFAIAHGDRCFLGATPERLLKVRGGQVSTTCLAGSYARGGSDHADRELAHALMADPKERREHALVLEDLTEKLSASCISLDLPAQPSVLKLPNVQHLCTPISGRLAPGRSALQIIEQIHPTPSVGGQPREAALRFIRARERLDRGWYTGPVGWLDYRGEGEFAVAIRAALLHGAQATLFAGCGIVADSDPEREYAESCIKLTPMLTALGAQ